MNVRLIMTEAAGELRAMLRNKKIYERLIHETRWTEGPVIIAGDGASRLAGLAASRVFEWLLGWPVIVRDAADLGRYLLPRLGPRSVLVAVSLSGEDEGLLETVEKAQRRGAVALAVTRDGESPLGKMARRAFLVPCAEEAPPAVRTAWLGHAALTYIAGLTATIFNPRHPLAGTWEEEFEGLAGRLEWLYTHLPDAVRSSAEVTRPALRLILTGGGLYHPPALEGARLGWQLAAGHVQAAAPGDLLDGAPGILGGADVALILSGSSCRLNKTIHTLAARLKSKNVPILSITDNNDRELVECSHLALLLPALSELAGPLLALALVHWIIFETGRHRPLPPPKR